MTIICVRNGIMAVDSSVSDGEMTVGGIKKFREVADIHGGGYVAAAGEVSISDLMLDAFGKTGTVEGTKEADFIHLKADGTTWHLERGGWYEYEAEFFAIGIGKYMALGAMAAGATAQKACEIACAYVDGCGGEVHVLTIDAAAEVGIAAQRGAA